MIRTQEATGKTVDEARVNACAKLGVQADDINVSYEVLEMPQKTGFLGLKPLQQKKLPPHSPWKRRRQRLPLLRAKRWKCPSISKKTTRSRPLWIICVRSSRGWAWRT